jgi:quinol monooxygenase YgiN
MAYVWQAELRVRPEKVGLWTPHLHNELSVLARKAGLLSARLLRDKLVPERFLSFEVWQNRAAAQNAHQSPEARLLAQARQAHGVDETPSVFVREMELIDHVWGRKGASAFLPIGAGFAQLVHVHVPAEKLDAWAPYRRNCGSIMARHNGVASYEMARDLADPTLFLVLRVYDDESFASIMKGATGPYTPTREIQYAIRAVQDLDLYAGSRPPEYIDGQLWDGVLGLSGIELYGEFMQGLEPV